MLAKLAIVYQSIHIRISFTYICKYFVNCSKQKKKKKKLDIYNNISYSVSIKQPQVSMLIVNKNVCQIGNRVLISYI